VVFFAIDAASPGPDAASAGPDAAQDAGVPPDATQVSADASSPDASANLDAQVAAGRGRVEMPVGCGSAVGGLGWGALLLLPWLAARARSRRRR
jgi:hypothetical protein